MARKKAVKEEEVAQEEVAQEQAAPESAPESISLSDLQLLLQVVDLATERGGFRGPELSQVGALRDKLGSFLEVVAQQQAAAAAAKEETEGE